LFRARELIKESIAAMPELDPATSTSTIKGFESWARSLREALAPAPEPEQQ
jgi:hypothetical protein